MKNLLPLILGLLLVHDADALAQSHIGSLSLDAFEIRPASMVELREMAGRQALCVEGVALLRDAWLRKGAVSVDVAATGERQFANLLFHASDPANYEEAYLRLHKSGQPDAVQYSPVMNGETNWQLFAQYQAVAYFPSGEWVTLRVDFDEHRALVTVGAQPVSSLKVGRLALGGRGSRIGLASLGGACFSNLRYSPDAQLSVSAGPPDVAPRPGMIRRWSLSPTLSFDGFAPRIGRIGKNWDLVTTEDDGVLLISRHRAKVKAGAYERNSTDFIYAGVTLRSDISRDVELELDMSDRARVYLNGRPIAEFDNSFRAKGLLFRGDFGLAQQRLFLPVVAGHNELIVAVAERANGWGLAARLASTEGIEVGPLQP